MSRRRSPSPPLRSASAASAGSAGSRRGAERRADAAAAALRLCTGSLGGTARSPSPSNPSPAHAASPPPQDGLRQQHEAALREALAGHWRALRDGDAARALPTLQEEVALLRRALELAEAGLPGDLGAELRAWGQHQRAAVDRAAAQAEEQEAARERLSAALSSLVDAGAPPEEQARLVADALDAALSAAGAMEQQRNAAAAALDRSRRALADERARAAAAEESLARCRVEADQLARQLAAAERRRLSGSSPQRGPEGGEHGRAAAEAAAEAAASPWRQRAAEGEAVRDKLAAEAARLRAEAEAERRQAQQQLQEAHRQLAELRARHLEEAEGHAQRAAAQLATLRQDLRDERAARAAAEGALERARQEVEEQRRAATAARGELRGAERRLAEQEGARQRAQSQADEAARGLQAAREREVELRGAGERAGELERRVQQLQEELQAREQAARAAQCVADPSDAANDAKWLDQGEPVHATRESAGDPDGPLQGMHALGAQLRRMYAEKPGDVADELMENLRFPPAAAAAADKLRALAAVARGVAELPGIADDLAGLSLAELLALRLYTQRPIDVDRDLGFLGVPPAERRGEAPAAVEKRKEYEKAHEDWSWAHAKGPRSRNGSVFQPVCAALRAAGGAGGAPEAAPTLRRWIKWLMAVTVACARPSRGSAAAVWRGLTRLPAEALEKHRSCSPGHVLGWPALSSTSHCREASESYVNGTAANAPPLDPEFPGAILFRVGGAAGAGQPLRRLSQYPCEEEFLLGPLSLFEVSSVSPGAVPTALFCELQYTGTVPFGGEGAGAFLDRCRADAERAAARLAAAAVTSLSRPLPAVLLAESSQSSARGGGALGAAQRELAAAREAAAAAGAERDASAAAAAAARGEAAGQAERCGEALRAAAQLREKTSAMEEVAREALEAARRAQQLAAVRAADCELGQAEARRAAAEAADAAGAAEQRALRAEHAAAELRAELERAAARAAQADEGRREAETDAAVMRSQLSAARRAEGELRRAGATAERASQERLQALRVQLAAAGGPVRRSSPRLPVPSGRGPGSPQ